MAAPSVKLHSTFGIDLRKTEGYDHLQSIMLPILLRFELLENVEQVQPQFIILWSLYGLAESS